MQVALIPPAALRDHMHLTAMQLFLPMWLDQYPTHKEDLVKRLMLSWQTIILDNGAAEKEKPSLERFKQQIMDFRPSEFALPDILFNGPATVEAAIGFGDLRPYVESGIRPGFVMQGATPEEAWWSLTKVLSYAAMKDTIKVVYIPRLLVKSYDNLARIRLAAKIHKTFPELEIHLFGASAIWPAEVCDAARKSYIRSIDTSFPYQAAFHGFDLDWRNPDLPMRVRRPKDYYTVEASEEFIELATQNVYTYLKWANSYE